MSQASGVRRRGQVAARRANGRGVRVQTWPEEVGPEPGGIEGSRFMGGQAWQGGSRPKIGHRLRPTSEDGSLRGTEARRKGTISMANSGTKAIDIFLAGPWGIG
ncbi:uncharacterized protein LOC125508254 [Triticum urartu]|uniref:uncharacterized protein LOC125508254 n=1 Tax=Triticum urartu TaxID=4572 RepID=UPI00204466CF|nr:uncharacterized protein LOC125508254 [Triticum urartu]